MVLNYKQIGVNIRDFRKERNLSQNVLAETTDMSVKYISSIETARKRASLESIVKIADALEVTVEQLLKGVQKNDKSGFATQLHCLVSDCNSYEKSVILSTATELKRSLRSNRDLLFKNR